MTRTILSAACLLLAPLMNPFPAAHAGTWEIDPVHSNLLYRVSHLEVGVTYGFIREFSGTLEFDPDAIEDASITVTANAASIDSLHPDRDAHLRSDDFFSVEEFASITFESDRWEDSGENAYLVTGTFSLLGVEREITVPVQFNGTAEDRRGQTVAGFEGTANIKRSDFGMDFGMGMIGDEVTLIIAFEAILQEEE
jgi:polyisoprenoid-binding protein YceI